MARATSWAWLAALVLTAGCSSLSVVDGELLMVPEAAFREGETRRAEVLARLGPPVRVSAAGSGVALLYERLELAESQLGFSLELLRMPYVKVLKGSGEAQRAALVLVFDSEGILQFWRLLEWSEELGSGASAQLLFTVESVVDTSFLDENWSPNDWGRTLLAPLAEGLNAASSVDLGQAGFELRGTPDSVGQRTLAEPAED